MGLVISSLYEIGPRVKRAGIGIASVIFVGSKKMEHGMQDDRRITGRPGRPGFWTRRDLKVFMERAEYDALHEHCQRLGVTMSAFVRELILKALGKKK